MSEYGKFMFFIWLFRKHASPIVSIPSLRVISVMLLPSNTLLAISFIFDGNAILEMFLSVIPLSILFSTTRRELFSAVFSMFVFLSFSFYISSFLHDIKFNVLLNKSNDKVILFICFIIFLQRYMSLFFLLYNLNVQGQCLKS